MTSPIYNTVQFADLIAQFAALWGAPAVLDALKAWAEHEERVGRAEGDSRWEEEHGRLADTLARVLEEVRVLARS